VKQKHGINIYPEITGDKHTGLKDSLAKGFDPIFPIVLYEDQVLDGWNRYLICKELNVEPVFKNFEGSILEAIQFVDASNARRDLNTFQRCEIALQREATFRGLAKEQQIRKPKPVSQISVKQKPIDTQKEVSKIAQTSHDSYAKAKTIVERATPEQKENARSGETTINKVYQDIKRAEKEEKREQRRSENKELIEKMPINETIETMAAKFATIVIDPPWDWGDEEDKDQLGRARPTYQTMPFQELIELPVGKLADDDCHIYLWITNRSLPKGFRLLDKWGFRYVVALTWCKPSIGMGNYFRGSTEHVLFGVKGSQPLKRKDIGTWFSANRDKRHSSKPGEFYELVESCSPGPYIDIFGRRARDGWIVKGAEI